MICAIAVLVDAELRNIFSGGEHEPVVVGGAGKRTAIDGWLAEGIVAIALDHVAVAIGEVSNATLVVVLVVIGPVRSRHSGVVAHQDFVNLSTVKGRRR